MIDPACGAAILVLPRRLPPGSRLWLVFPSPREGRQEDIESLALPNAPRTSPSRKEVFPISREGRQEGRGSLFLPRISVIE